MVVGRELERPPCTATGGGRGRLPGGEGFAEAAADPARTAARTAAADGGALVSGGPLDDSAERGRGGGPLVPEMVGPLTREADAAVAAAAPPGGRVFGAAFVAASASC